MIYKVSHNTKTKKNRNNKIFPRISALWKRRLFLVYIPFTTFVYLLKIPLSWWRLWFSTLFRFESMCWFLCFGFRRNSFRKIFVVFGGRSLPPARAIQLQWKNDPRTNNWDVIEWRLRLGVARTNTITINDDFPRNGMQFAVAKCGWWIFVAVWLE